jgi:hypothetical protein
VGQMVYQGSVRFKDGIFREKVEDLVDEKCAFSTSLDGDQDYLDVVSIALSYMREIHRCNICKRIVATEYEHSCTETLKIDNPSGKEAGA